MKYYNRAKTARPTNREKWAVWGFVFLPYSYSRNCRKSGVGGLWRREGRICGRYVICLSLRLRFGKYASFQSMYSSTVILPLEQSSRLVRAAYFHFLKSGCLI